MWKYYLRDGQLRAVDKFIDDKMTGARKWYRENGKLVQTGSFTDEKESGVWKRYHPNGALYDEGKSSNNRKVGEWRVYDAKGKLVKTANHKLRSKNPWAPNSNGRELLRTTMNEKEFRAMALQVPGAVEAAHMDHPDFRVNGKIFASLGYPDDGWGMVKLTSTQQRSFMKEAPGTFAPCAGAWGRGGATSVHLASARKRILSKALIAASGNIIKKTGA